MNDKLKDIALRAAAQIRGDAPVPSPDEWDIKKLPFGATAGRNTFKLAVCPFCGKSPTVSPGGYLTVFLFRDYESAKEYEFSGLCQTCQDATFNQEEI